MWESDRKCGRAKEKVGERGRERKWGVRRPEREWERVGVGESVVLRDSVLESGRARESGKARKSGRARE